MEKSIIKSIMLLCIIPIIFNFGTKAMNQNVNKIIIEDNDMKIAILLNKTYNPGDTIKVDFYITNKKEDINTIYLKLDVFYFCKKVFSYSHPSWREYKQNETVHIYHKSKLPLLLPPGKYRLKFYIHPVGQKIKTGETVILVNTTPIFYGFVATILVTSAAILSILKKYWEYIKNYYINLSVGQRFVLIAIILLTISGIIITLDLEYVANEFAIIAYFCLLVGVGNLIFEEINNNKKINNILRESMSMFILGVLVYLSKIKISTYASLTFALIGSIMLFKSIKNLETKTQNIATNNAKPKDSVLPKTKKISVIIPTKNEEKTISKVIAKTKETLENLNLPYEIIVVDNSSDNTPKIAKSMGAIVIEGVVGYGKAYIEGFKIVRGDYIIMFDADGTYDPKEITKLIKPLLSCKVDLVIGSRFKGKIMPKAMPWLHRYIGNPLLTFILNILFKTRISDAHSGMRALTREALKKLNLKCTGMEFATEMIIEAKRKGLRIVEVPITYYPRVGKSKLKSFRDGWRHLRLMLMYSPTHMFILPGLTALILGMTVTFYVLFLNPIKYHSQILGNLLIILGIQILFFGLTIKIHASEIGFIEEDRVIKLFDRPSVVEAGILTGVILVLIGVLAGYYIFKTWIDINFGKLNFLNLSITISSLIIIGIQIIFNVLFIGSLKILNEKW